jgi:hypothetical protein
MSQDSQAIKNKQQKVYFEQYLSNSSEPLDNVSSDMPPELEAELLTNSHFMRRQVRRIAQRMRRRYSS